MGLTKEEKKAKKEAKLLLKLQEEEKLRKKLKIDELNREVTTLESQRGVLDKNWHEIMLKIKEPVFKQDIRVMWHTFERVLDKKDAIVKRTLQLMEAADDQFQRTVAAFCDRFDGMINTFLADLEALAKDNDLRTAELLKKVDDDATKISTAQSAAETHLNLLLFHSHTTSDQTAWATRGENMVKQDEDSAKFEEDRDNLRSFLENNYNATWDEYKAVLKSYIVNTADNQKQLRKLRRKENLMADIINSQGKKIATSGSVLKKLRAELSAYESGTKQAVFRDRRNRYREACFQLKKKMYDGVSTDMKQLIRLVRDSNDAVEWLEAAYNKVEKILRMASLCRKHETRREKVLPFDSCVPQSPAQQKSSLRQTQSDETIIVNAMVATTGLTRLWHRISKAELTKRALYQEKTLLEKENEFLVSQLEGANQIEMSPDAYKCICTKEVQSKLKTDYDVNKPASVDAKQEVAKYLIGGNKQQET